MTENIKLDFMSVTHEKPNYTKLVSGVGLLSCKTYDQNKLMLTWSESQNYKLCYTQL